MGFFSFITNDTGYSVSNVESQYRAYPVYLIDDKGNKWFEKAYEGYGEFGGKDIHVLFAEMNNLVAVREVSWDDEMYHETLRCAGIEAWCKCENDKAMEATMKFPNLVYDSTRKWVNERPRTCPCQGYFYDDSRYMPIHF